MHQAMSITTITVTNFMICNAFSLDSETPLVFCHQKYNVTTMAKLAAIKLIVVEASGPLTWKYCRDRKSTRLNSSHTVISYAVFCLKKKKKKKTKTYK